MSIFKYILHWIIPIVSTIICTAFYFTADYKNMAITFGISFSLTIVLSLLYDFIQKKLNKTEENEVPNPIDSMIEVQQPKAEVYIDTDKASRLEIEDINDMDDMEELEEEKPILSEVPAVEKERTKRGFFSVD